MRQKDKPLVRMPEKKREEFWDEVYAKEEGIIIELDEKKSGKIRSLSDGNSYIIDSWKLVGTDGLHIGDKVLFAPFEDEKEDYASVIRIIE